MPIYKSETEKIRPKLVKYLELCPGVILDIGCGTDLITANAMGIDARRFPHVKHCTTDLYSLSKQLGGFVGRCDMVFSSHCLEHLKEDKRAFDDWANMVKPGGFFVLYLPCDKKYNNEANPEHLQRYTLESFLDKFSYSDLKVVESFEHYDTECYSFCVVFKKPSSI